jgi:hypothetical protein
MTENVQKLNIDMDTAFNFICKMVLTIHRLELKVVELSEKLAKNPVLYCTVEGCKHSKGLKIKPFATLQQLQRHMAGSECRGTQSTCAVCSKWVKRTKMAEHTRHFHNF